MKITLSAAQIPALLDSFGWKVFDDSSYRSDLALSDFHPFQYFKHHFGGNHNNDDEYVKKAMTSWLTELAVSLCDEDACNGRQLRDLIIEIDDCYKDFYQNKYHTGKEFFGEANSCVKRVEKSVCTMKRERMFRQTLKETITVLKKFSVESFEPTDGASSVKTKKCLEKINITMLDPCIPDLHSYAEAHWRGNPISDEKTVTCFDTHTKDCHKKALGRILKNYLLIIDHKSLCKETTTEETTTETEAVYKDDDTIIAYNEHGESEYE
nr:uncharacterized protein LOC107437632 [Parasteatoda tepidariorum]